MLNAWYPLLISPVLWTGTIRYCIEDLGQNLQKPEFTEAFYLHGSIFEWVNGIYEVVDMENLGAKGHTHYEKWSRYVTSLNIRKAE